MRYALALALLAGIVGACNPFAPRLDGSSLAACEGSVRAARGGPHAEDAEAAWDRLQYRAAYTDAVSMRKRGADHELEALCREHDGRTLADIAAGD